MQSSLGIYIEDNIIKYAKLQKEKDVVKVDAYNVAFYDNDLEDTLNRIISETYSYKTPISINISNEIYNSFDVSALLNKGDTKKSVEIEFEMLCNEKGYNKNSLEHKYIVSEQREDPEKLKIISVMANKNDLQKKINYFDTNRVTTATPITTSVTNLVSIDGRENIAIVNIEENTKVTVVIDGQIHDILVIDEGMGKILGDINKIENSMSKSYEVCKNVTIYTQNSTELYSETNEYMNTVTETLQKIVTQIKDMISQSFSSIDKIYLTGLGTCINNIDLYFQEYIPSAKCEILRPYFLKNVMQLPIKEYIEVNSAIALALDGLGMINKDVNFTKSSGGSGLNKEIDLKAITRYFANFNYNVKVDFSQPLKSVDKLLLRGIAACFITAGVFVLFSNVISGQIENKKSEVELLTADTNNELGKVDSDIKTISSRTETYQELIDEITNPTQTETDEDGLPKEVTISKDAIPNLLNRVMFVIPKKVKLTSIQNTTSNHIEIKAQAEKYEQLGYFKAVLSTNGILENVKSTSGQKNGDVVEVTIEGDLP